MRHRPVGPLIAVVDDDTAFVDMVCEFLADEGYQVIACLHGTDAFPLIRDTRPAVVILDIRLEHARAGWTILEFLRRVPATKDIPVIICSADTFFLRAHAHQLRKHNCELVYKPFDLDALLEKITVIVGNAQVRVAEGIARSSPTTTSEQSSPGWLLSSGSAGTP